MLELFESIRLGPKRIIRCGADAFVDCGSGRMSR